MTDEERQRCIRNALAHDLETGKSAWYYLSFADETGFLGACIVNALGPTDAARQARLVGANPGGEVMITQLPDDVPLTDAMKNRLLTFQDMVDLGMEPGKASDSLEDKP